jgi:hypothetical protein
MVESNKTPHILPIKILGGKGHMAKIEFFIISNLLILNSKSKEKKI